MAVRRRRTSLGDARISKGQSPPKRSIFPAYSAISAWVLLGLLLGILWSEYKTRAVHPSFLLPAILAGLMGVSTLVGALSSGIRMFRGPERLTALGWFAAAVLPPMLLATPVWYSLGCQERGYAPNNLPYNITKIIDASMMEGAAPTYPFFLESKNLVMRYTLAVHNPRRDSNAMEKHIVRLTTLLGKPLRDKIRWVRGPLLSQNSLSVCGTVLGSEGSLGHDPFQDDRKNLAKAVIWQQQPIGADPPTMLSEGFAEYESEMTDSERAMDALELHNNGSWVAVGELIGSGWYHQETGPVSREGAAFVGYLLRRYGAEKFLQLYNGCKPDTILNDVKIVYGMDIDALERAFWNDARRIADK